jgi:hypothetical protein
MENKTAKREALVVCLKDHPYFEEAHLFLKDGNIPVEESDMVKEATRIIAAYRAEKGAKKQRAHRHSPLFYFVCGMASALLCTLLATIPFLFLK